MRRVVGDLEDLREEFVRDYVWPMFRANAVYEHDYLLGTAVARPLIAKRQAEIALEIGADAVAHGATGKGNDQVRFELGYFAHAPGVQIIAPWREWDFKLAKQTAGLRRRPRHSRWSKSAGKKRPTAWTRICCIFPTKAASWKTR